MEPAAREVRISRINRQCGRAQLRWGTGVAFLAILGCADSGIVQIEPTGTEPHTDLRACRVTAEALFDGGPGRDGIPSLVNPVLVPVDDPSAEYMDEYVERSSGTTDAPVARVVGLRINDTPIAIPHNILWWHEIVNLDLGGRRVAVTYCPLTGSALAFDLTSLGARRFGVSGLIYQNNLVMFDEETESLWPQLCRTAALGPRAGTNLMQVPVVEMRWESWKARHPTSLVVSAETGFNRDYARYPYRNYERSTRLLFSMPAPLDQRRSIKERVFGFPSGEGGLAFPFEELDKAGRAVVVPLSQNNTEIVVLWDSDAQAAAAFLPATVNGEPATLQARDGSFVDVESGSRWDIQGIALEGPRAQQRLVPFADAHVVFWFAWAAFHPRTAIWTAE